MENKYNYSFIIPHKNIPDLLRRCVSSIPRRNDVQIIIVDDNSDEQKVDFSNFPFQDDPHVEVYFDKTGKGAGHARNVGLEHAQGKWLVFVDADDYLLYNINDILDEYLNSDSDIIYFMSNNVDSITYLNEKVNDRCELINRLVRNYLSDKSQEDMLRFTHVPPWGKLVRREIVVKNNIKFEEIKRFNDVHFSYKSAFYANKIEARAIAMYCLTSRNDNITSVVSSDTWLLFVQVWVRFMKFLKEKKKEQSPAFEYAEKLVFYKLVSMHKKDVTMYEDAIAFMKDSGFTDLYISKKYSKYHRRALASDLKKILRIK